MTMGLFKKIDYEKERKELGRLLQDELNQTMIPDEGIRDEQEEALRKEMLSRLGRLISVLREVKGRG